MYKVIFITLGCAKNTVLTEYMMGVLDSSKYILTENHDEADIAIVNTCGFINDAKEESVNLILELIELKNINKKLKEARDKFRPIKKAGEQIKEIVEKILDNKKS